MKITTKGRYAIHILYDLAVNGTEHPVSVKEMATRQEISVKYTEQIISILNKAGYVSSSRGFQGGYRLTKPLDEYVIVAHFCCLGQGFSAFARHSTGASDPSVRRRISPITYSSNGFVRR